MARGRHGLPKVLLGPTMPYLSMPHHALPFYALQAATPETALWPYQSRPPAGEATRRGNHPQWRPPTGEAACRKSRPQGRPPAAVAAHRGGGLWMSTIPLDTLHHTPLKKRQIIKTEYWLPEHQVHGYSSQMSNNNCMLKLLCAWDFVSTLFTDKNHK